MHYYSTLTKKRLDNYKERGYNILEGKELKDSIQELANTVSKTYLSTNWTGNTLLEANVFIAGGFLRDAYFRAYENKSYVFKDISL